MRNIAITVAMLGMMWGGWLLHAQTRIAPNQLPGMGVTVDAVTGTSLTVACGNTLATSDALHMKLFSSSSSIAVSLFQAGTCQWAQNFNFAVASQSGTGTITITPTTSTIGAIGGSQSSTLTVSAGHVYFIYTDVVSSGCTSNGCWDAVEVQ